MPGLIRPHAITMSRVKFPSNRTTVTVLQSFSFSAESLEIFYQVPKNTVLYLMIKCKLDISSVSQ